MASQYHFGHYPPVTKLHEKQIAFLIGYAPSFPHINSNFEGDDGRGGKLSVVTFQNEEDYKNAVQLMNDQSEMVFRVIPAVRRHLEEKDGPEAR